MEIEVIFNEQDNFECDFGEIVERIKEVEVIVPEYIEVDTKFRKYVQRQPFEVTAEDFGDMTEIRDYAFQYSSIGKVTIPSTITQIGNYVFANCSSLESIAILNSVTSIGIYAFSNCGLTSVMIPDSVTSIGSSAFRSCSSLTSITIGNSVTTMGTQAFLNVGSSSNKATITMLPTTPPTIQSNTFTTGYLNQIIVPKGCLGAYQNATNWSSLGSKMVEANE
jgi:hypothetical protein